MFIPILLMGGLLGRLFREFSVTLAVAIGVSLIVSLTTTPMMCAKFLRDQHDRKHGWLYRITRRPSISFMADYARSLAMVLRHPQLTLMALLSTIGLNVYLFVIVPKGFFPQQDTGRIVGCVQASQDISFKRHGPEDASVCARSLSRIQP